MPDGLSVETLWEVITAEPGIGIWIVTLEGLIVYANDQAAAMFNGPGSKGADYKGRNIRDLHSQEWVRERLAVLRRVLLLGKPVIVRAIWRGYQQTSTISYIEAEPEDEADSPEHKPVPAPARFLVLTRRIPADAAAEPQADESRYEFIDSKEVDLGPMDVLTTRELEVLSLIGQGMSTKEIAQTLFRSAKTVDKHRTSIMNKLAAHDRLQLAEIAGRAGLTLKDAGKPRA